MLAVSQPLIDVALTITAIAALVITLALLDGTPLLRDILDILKPDRVVRRHPSASAARPTGTVRRIPARPFDAERDA